jgi:hypothetical protein
LERIFNCFADFATDFWNGNIMSKSHPITELNTNAFVGALTVMKAFCDQINLHQATMLPIAISQNLVASYNISPWNNTQIWGRPLGGKSGSETKPSPEQRRGDKRDPTTPPDAANDANSSNRQKQKKPKRGVKVNTAAKERGRIWVCFISRIHPSTHPMFFQRSCLRRSVQISPARVKSAAMLHATSSIPGSHPSSKAKLSSRSPTISTKLTSVGLMNTIS